MIKLLSLRAAKFKQLEDVALSFPGRGSVLIQGLNEAGKSTLFESVFFGLFGKALVTEEPNRLDDLITYQSSRSMVKLAFSTDDASFTVSRTLNRGKANTAVLDVEYVNGKRETVTNLSNVNRRIVDELGLDGEALLNSCFVEQKKLEKLESMTAQQRRDTLLRLLNLDRLAALESHYKPSPADEIQHQQLRDRLRLAEVQRDLPLALERLQGLEAELRVLSGARLLHDLAQLNETVANEQRRQQELSVDGAGLADALAEVERLEKIRDLARAAGETLRGVEEDRAEIERLARERSQYQAEADRVPDLEKEVDRLERLAGELAEAGKRARQGELLRDWLAIREVALIAERSELELGQLRSEVAGLEGEAAEHSAALRLAQRTALAMGVVAFVAVSTGIWLLSTGHLAGLAGLAGAGAFAFLALRFALQARRAASAQAAAEAGGMAVQADVNRREGEQGLAQRTGQDPRRLADIESELASLGFAVPESPEEAHTALRSLDAADVPEGSSEAATEAEARERAATARAAHRAAIEAGKRAAAAHDALSAREARLLQRQHELEESWPPLTELRPDVEQHVDGCRALWREMGERISALDEPALRTKAAANVQAIAASEERASAARRRHTEAQTELDSLGLAPQELAALEGVSADELPDRESALQSKQRDVIGEVASLRDHQTRLEQQLALQDVAVDHADAERELLDFEQQLQVRKQAHRIVTLARRNIVTKVLPSTVRNMGLLLPLLTNDRYRDVDIDPETYKIKVWDESARAMKAKDIFSGGTRDQFSLALRLAFALATLPEELGTAPGFIFLDEPLSSFDAVRGSALVNLLTRGPVATSFEQIFVISHSRAFDETLFDYHLQLEAGQIVESDLPQVTAGTEADQEMQLELAPA